MPQSEQQFAGQIATAVVDLQRRDERLAWSRRMLGKGYVAAGRVAVEEQARMRAACRPGSASGRTCPASAPLRPEGATKPGGPGRDGADRAGL